MARCEEVMTIHNNGKRLGRKVGERLILQPIKGQSKGLTIIDNIGVANIKNPAYGRHRISRPMRIEKNSIRNDSLFLRLYELVPKCTSPLVEHLPRVDLPRVQSTTTPCFYGSMSWSTSAPVH